MKFPVSLLIFGQALAQDYSFSYNPGDTTIPTATSATASQSSPVQSSSSDACALLKSRENKAQQYQPKDAYNCLKAIPFVKNDAARFLAKYKAFVLHQTTIGWLNDPPSTYKQPAVDILGGLDNISNKINTGYSSLYDFEYDLRSLIAKGHDGHFSLAFGSTQYWSFTNPYNFITISSDGKSVPKVYAFPSGSQNFQYTIDTLTQQSAVTKINGRRTVEFLSELASNNSNNVEPHADWNAVNTSPQGDLHFGSATGSTFYYGIDTYTLEFENGTSTNPPGYSTARFNGQTLPANVNDYYNNYVLAASSDSNNAAATPTFDPAQDSDPTPTTFVGSAERRQVLPAASTSALDLDLAQRDNSALLDWSQDWKAFPPSDVGIDSGPGLSWATGYFLGDLGVLNIPSFGFSANHKVATRGFQATVRQFILAAQTKQISKIIIDIRSNGGGLTFTGAELFKQFFPGIFPNDRVRFRLNDIANMGGAIGEQLYINSNADTTPAAKSAALNLPWTPQVAINPATNSTYHSWSELSPGYTQKGDSYTNNLEFDFPDPVIDESWTGDDNGANGIDITGFTPSTPQSPANWGPNDIAILTDGLCGSTCAWFSDLFRTFGQGKMITIGGRPESGPMQAYSGVRGNNVLEWESWTTGVLPLIVKNINLVPGLNVSAIPSANDVFKVNKANVNLRDTLRPGKSWPNQFAYIPADCRMYWTASTINNYTALWKSAANALWNTPSDVPGYCVDGSTNLKEVTPDDVASTTASGSIPSPTGNNSAARTGGQSLGLLALSLIGFALL